MSRPSQEPLNELHFRDVSTTDPYDYQKDALANKNFRKWWKRGRHLMSILFAGTAIAGISLLCSINIFYQIFFSSTNNFC